jgi:hypothetical protein
MIEVSMILMSAPLILIPLAIRLILIASGLIRIALALYGLIRAKPLVHSALRFALPPSARRAPEARPECSRKRLGGAEAHRQRDIQDRHARLGGEPHRSHFQPAAAQVIAERLVHPCREQPMEMKRREMRDFGELGKLERPIEILIDMR